VVWLALCASRSVTQWLAIFGLGSFVSLSPEQLLDGSPLDRTAYSALTAAAIFVLVQRQQKTAALLRKNWPILLFFAYCLLSVIWSDYPDVAFKRWVKAVGDLVMVLIVLTESDPVAATKRLFTRVAFVLLPVSVLFIKYFPELGREFHPGGVGGTWSAAYTGVTTSKNLLGMLTLLMGVAMEWCFLQAFRARKATRKNGPVIAYAILLGIVVWLMMMAQSATALSCLAMGAGLIALGELRIFTRKPMLARLYVFGTVSLALFALFGESGGGLLGAVGRDSTLTGRTDVWRLALAMAGNPLVGTGFESFWLGSRIERTRNAFRFVLQSSHNGYLELYLTLGWIGIALLGVLIVTGYRNLLTTLRRDPPMGTLKMAFFLVALVYNLTEVGFRVQNPVWILFLWAVIAVPAPVPSKPSPAQGTGRTGRLIDRKTSIAFALERGFREKTI
jgi:exopolysaccharide production protein ExoQ